MSTDTLLLADSEIARLRPDGADLHLHFSAACVRRQSGDGLPVEGYARGVVWQLAEALCDGSITDAFGRLRGGRLLHDNRWQAELPLAATLNGPLTLELDFARGDTLRIDAQGLRSHAPEPLSFTESLAC